MSTRVTAGGAGSAALALASAAASGLGAPRSIWIACAIAAIALFVYATLQFFNRRGQPMTADGGRHYHIESHDQQGGITGHVEIHSAPQPGVRDVKIDFANREESGSYLTRGIVQLDSSYAAQALQVRVDGSSIKDFQLYPVNPAMAAQGITGSGMMNVMTGDDFPNGAFFQVGAPLAPLYWADVRTAEPDDLKFQVALQ